MTKLKRFFYLSTMTVLAVLAVILVMYKAGINEEYIQQTIQQEQERELRALSGKENNRGIYLATIAEVTTSQFNEAYGPPKRFVATNTSELAEYTHTYISRPGQRTYYLLFKEGTLQKYFSAYNPNRITTDSEPGPPGFELSEWIRTTVLYTSLILWAVLMLLGLTVRCVRNHIGILPLVAAVICVLAITLAPGYTHHLGMACKVIGILLMGVMIIASLLYSSAATCPE